MKTLKQGKLKKEFRIEEILNIDKLVEIDDFDIHKIDLKLSFNRMTKIPDFFGVLQLNIKNDYGDYLMMYCKLSKALDLRVVVRELLKEHIGLKNGIKTGDKDFWSASPRLKAGACCSSKPSDWF